jgi:hypothetical protein
VPKLADQPSSVRPSAANAELMASHPVIRNTAHLPTPPIKSAYAELAEAVAERDVGVSYVAFSRFGKTFAISVLGEQLANAFPEVPILSAIAKGHDRFSEGNFYAEVLEGCTKAQVASARPRPLHDKLLRYLWTLAESRNSDRIVLFVDEAQNWQERELSVLRDLSNDLGGLGEIQLIVNLFGAPSLASTRAALLESGRTDLVGRFMMRQYELFGIRSKDDLAATMQCYDDPEISEFPQNSGVSYSEFFLGLAFRSGWRLEHEFATLWNEYSKAAQPHGGVGQIGMKWIASTLRRFLVEQSVRDSPGFKGRPEEWQRAVTRSGFAQTLGVTYSSQLNLAAAAHQKTHDVPRSSANR